MCHSRIGRCSRSCGQIYNLNQYVHINVYRKIDMHMYELTITKPVICSTMPFEDRSLQSSMWPNIYIDPDLDVHVNVYRYIEIVICINSRVCTPSSVRRWHSRIGRCSNSYGRRDSWLRSLLRCIIRTRVLRERARLIWTQHRCVYR